MAAGPLSIKLKCTSWQQLSTIYKRDLSRGTMFLKAASPPPLGTAVRIDLTLPSSSVIVLNGVVDQHVNDPTRGAGVELKLAPIPAGSVWMIESALASEQKRRATPVAGVPISASSTGSVPAIGQSQPIQAIDEGQDVANAENDLVRALLSEAESLKKLNPFLVLGVGYEAGDSDVRAAFGELTKRYHPDLFARYESKELRTVAAEIFILIRDAYRKLGDDAGRQQALQALGRTSAPRAVPNRAPTPPPVPVKPPRAPTGVVPIIAPPPPPQARPFSDAQETVRPGEMPSFESKTGENKVQVPPRIAPAVTTPLPTRGDPTPPPVRAPPPTAKQPALPPIRPILPMPEAPGTAPTERATATGSQGMRPRPPTEPPPLPAQAKRVQTQPESVPPPPVQTDRRPVATAPPVLGNDPASSSDAIEEMLDAGNVENALNAYKVMSKKNPTDRSLRAGVELCEGLRALSLRDRLEAAQRFEAALEIDPSNERAARELAEMRRQATNERKGLLTRLMGKKEP
ncbi:hypothetical protein BH11MYX2_BH11MYX2_20960 [soil metagenome]